MDIDIQHGRIIVNKLNARGRVDIARNLIQAHVLNDKIAADALSKFTKLGEKIDPQLQNKRDMLAHGQMSLANVLACAQSTQNLVLLGDEGAQGSIP
jgi:hypothetical protein